MINIANKKNKKKSFLSQNGMSNYQKLDDSSNYQKQLIEALKWVSKCHDHKWFSKLPKTRIFLESIKQ